MLHLRSCAFLFVGFLAIAFPAASGPDTDTVTDDARWKNGELRAPLPSDPARRAAAIREAKALGESRSRPVSAKSTTYTSSTTPPPVAYPMRATPRTRTGALPMADPAAVAWLNDLELRLRRSEQALATRDSRSPSSVSESDPAVLEFDPASPATTTTTFDGIDDTGWDPGAPDIAAGPGHILIATTDRFAVMDKCGNTLLTGLFRNFFNLPMTRTYYTPKVLYDPWTPRWIMLYIGTETNYSNSVLYIAVSETADPLGDWYYYPVPTTAFLPGLKDGPAIAVTPDEIYITYNQFNLGTFAFEQAVILELIKNNVYSQLAVTLSNHQGMLNPNDASIAFSIHPAQMRTYAGPMYFVNSKQSGDNFFTLWHLIGAPGASVLTGMDVPSFAYVTPSDMEQPDGTLVDASDCRVRDAVYSSGKMYAAFTRDIMGSPRVHLQQIDVVTLDDTGLGLGGNDLAYPAIDIDENDQITFACALSGPAFFLGVGYNIVRFPNSSVGSGVIASGLANFASGIEPYRWGPYFGAALDPADDRTVWIHGTYASDNPVNSWTTRVGAVTAFTPSNLSVEALTTTYVAGYEGGPFAPSQIDFELSNTGATDAAWRVSGVPLWLTPEDVSGSLDAGASETISFFVNGEATVFGPGNYPAVLTFSNCTGTGGVGHGVSLAVGVDGSCPGVRLALAPPVPPTGSIFVAPAEVGAYVTAIEDVNVCAIGIEADLVLPQDITVTVYLADGTTRLAEVTSAPFTAVQDASTMHFIPLSVTLDACQEYDIAITFGSSVTFPYWDDTLPGFPVDVGGLVRVRDAEADGNASSVFLPRIVLIAEGGVCSNSTDLDAGAGGGFEATSNTAQGLFVTPERTLQLCSLGLEADLTPGTNLTARIYSAFGGLRTALLAEGTALVTSSLFTFHDVPISQVLLAGSQYDIEIEFEGTGAWWSYSIPPATIPYSVDNTMLIYGAEASGVVTALIPHLRFAWSEPGAGTPFDLAKPGEPNPPPSSSSNSLTHGAFITALADQEIYGLGVMADIPKGGFVTAYLYEAVLNTRGALLATGVVVSDGAGMQWHDVPISASLTPGHYDIMFSAPMPVTWPYWQDSPGLPYVAYGLIRVRDGEAGGNAGTSFLAHMRVFACNPVFTAVGDGPMRTPMMLEPPAPNPTTGIVRFGYSVDEAGPVEIAVYDARGSRVASVARARDAGVGRNVVDFDTRKLASGVYFVKLTTRTKATSRKFVVTH